MLLPGSEEIGKATLTHPIAGGRGSLARIARVEPRQVVKLSALFSLWVLLPLVLLLAVQQRLEISPSAGFSLFNATTLWSVLFVCLALVLAIALSMALAFSIARQQAMANALEQAINNLPMQFAYIDANRCYRFNNRAHHATCTERERANFGRSVQDVLGERVYRQVEPYLDRALAGQRVDFELRLPVGAAFCDLAVSYLPDMAKEGEVKGVFVLADDISARKQSERRDKEQLLEFAHISRLASVGEVAAEIAHQINQPLAAIAMFSSAAERTLASGGDASQVRGWLATINAQSKRASEVIDSLRRFVRPGKMDPVALDLNVPLREVAALLTHDAAARRVGLSLELANDLPPVMATGVLIEQVVFNLARNAIKIEAGKLRPGQVTIRSRADAERVWVEVVGEVDSDMQEMETCPLETDVRQPEVQHQVQPEAATDSVLGFSLAISRSIIAGFSGEVGCHHESECAFCYFNLPRCRP
jgi:signal transduction histidine kinase